MSSNGEKIALFFRMQAMKAVKLAWLLFLVWFGRTILREKL